MHGTTSESPNRWGIFFVFLQIGFAEFTLPLIYAAVYPVIIISREQELRERYLRRVAAWFSCANRANADGDAVLVEE